MTELLWFAAAYVLLAVVCLVRVAKGPSVVDRAVAADSVDILTDVALVLFALYSGRAIYLDIALVRPCADVFQPHVVRASMGAIFSLRIREFDDFESMSKAADKRMYAAKSEYYKARGYDRRRR